LTTLADLDSHTRDFLTALHSATDGDTGAQISMYTVGETVGIDREASSETAEDLMGLGLVEIRTLAGAIGLSQAGADLMAGPPAAGGDPARRLGTASPMSADQCALVETLLAALKHDIGSRGLSYETIAEIVADCRTIEAQMTSPKPKTAVVRECLGGLMAIAAAHGQTEWQNRLQELLG
jgi:hypothetical protein